MKKLAFLLAMVLGVTNMNAQDYDLQGLAKACEEYSTDDSLYPTMSSFHDGLAAVSKEVGIHRQKGHSRNSPTI